MTPPEPNYGFADFIVWAFYGGVGFGVYAVVRILGQMRDSVNALTVNVAVIIEKTSQHDKLLDKHSEEIEALKERKQ